MWAALRMAAFLGALAMAVGCAANGGTRVNLSDAGTATGFINMTTASDGREQPCVLYVPRNYDPSEPWPLVVFLHGMGERGSDGLRQTAVGIGPAIQRRPNSFPCLVLMPQCPSDSIWATSDARWARNAKDASGHVDDAIAQVLERYTVDRDRISLTGLSMGGYGTFMYGARHIDTFSALMPICGGGDVKDAAVLARAPLWVFHGGDDPVVSPKKSKEMVEAVRAAGGNVQYTEYPGVHHNSWEKAYADRKAIRWLLEQKRD